MVDISPKSKALAALGEVQRKASKVVSSGTDDAGRSYGLLDEERMLKDFLSDAYEDLRAVDDQIGRLIERRNKLVETIDNLKKRGVTLHDTRK